MNFLKGSLFRRNTEPEELEPMEESGGGILAVWGSPGCGKSVTAVKIAKHLAAQKKNTVLLLCDMTAPMMPCICPPSELEVDKSLGSIFAAQHISVNLIKHNLTTLIAGDYKIVVEPIAYFVYGGAYCSPSYHRRSTMSKEIYTCDACHYQGI